MKSLACDMCGSEISGHMYPTIITTENRKKVEKDLCESCNIELNEMFDGKDSSMGIFG